MSAAAVSDPRPKLSLAEVVALQLQLAADGLRLERRAEIRRTLELARQREEVADVLREPRNLPVFDLCRAVLVEDEQREREAKDRTREKARLARLEEHRQHVAGRPARFAALPKTRQACLVAEAAAARNPRAGWPAFADALEALEAGDVLAVPFTFDPECLAYGEIVRLHREGLVDDDFAEQARQRNLRGDM
jgi:hypothetical protein